MATWLFSKKPGTGQCHMVWPMEKYISTSRKPREQRSRRLSFGVSVSRSSSWAEAALLLAAPFTDAP